jgi:periplasmic copper chaperone A
MKTKIAVSAAALLLVLMPGAHAEDYKTGTLTIQQPWARATPGGAKVGAGYLKITNSGTESDRLIGGSTAIAGTLEIHEMSMTNDVMKMKVLPAGIEIKPGATVELKPNSYHLMLMDLKEPLQAGQKFKATLQFEKAGKVDVEFDVQSIGAQKPMHAH